MAAEKPGLVTTVSILTRRLREGKTYEDFRRAWFHTTGFGVKGKDVEGSSARLLTFINVFDPREVIVLGFATTTPEQLKDALDIDVKVRGENPLDNVIEPAVGRSFALQVAGDDFSAAGDIPYCPPMIAGKETGMAGFEKNMTAIQALYAAAAVNRDKVTLHYQEVPDSIMILIEDNGPGIPVTDKEKIFERGYARKGGSGLFLAREILSITGITIQETGEPGAGARFEILVPKGAWRVSGTA